MSSLAGAPHEEVTLREISPKARQEAKASDCAGKNKSFPILKPADVAAAAKAIGRAGADNYTGDKLKANIIRIAKRKGAAFVAQLPKAWTETAAAHALSDVFVGRIALADAETGKPRVSWIQLFKTGKYWDPRYGNFAITAKDLSEMLENFKTVTPEPPTRLPIDYNHGTSHPSSAEEGKAAGWMTDLALRAAGAELWALVEWTETAAEMIVAKEYQFVSPTFAYNHTHSNGDEIGTTLLAAAITNRPVLEGMEPLTLSARGALRLADATESDGSVDEAAEAMFSYDEQRRRVQAALASAFGVVYGFGDCGPCSGCYLVDLFDGAAVYREYDGDLYQVHFAISTDGEVSFTDTPVEVRVAYAPLTAPGEQTMAKTITVKDATGKDVQLTEEVVLAVAKEHAPAPAAGAPTVELAKFTALEEQVLSLTAKNAALELDNKTRDVTVRVEKLIRAGKLVPADRDETIALGMTNTVAFELYEKQMAKRAAVVEYGRRIGTEDGTELTSATDEVIALSRTEQEKNVKLSSGDAMALVFKKNPTLYERYKTETAVKV